MEVQSKHDSDQRAVVAQSATTEQNALVAVAGEGMTAGADDGDEDDDDEEEEEETDRALLSIGLDPRLIRDTRPVGFDAVSEDMLAALDRRRQEAAAAEDYEAAQVHRDAYQSCVVAATALQAVSKAFQLAMEREDFDDAAKLKARAQELRSDQERAFDPVGFEKIERRKEKWRRSFGGDGANVDQCLVAYHALVAEGRATVKEREAFLSCIRGNLATSLAPAFLEVESMALAAGVATRAVPNVPR